jgi:hypothetical protein
MIFPNASFGPAEDFYLCRSGLPRGTGGHSQFRWLKVETAEGLPGWTAAVKYA